MPQEHFEREVMFELSFIMRERERDTKGGRLLQKAKVIYSYMKNPSRFSIPLF